MVFENAFKVAGAAFAGVLTIAAASHYAANQIDPEGKDTRLFECAPKQILYCKNPIRFERPEYQIKFEMKDGEIVAGNLGRLEESVERIWVSIPSVEKSIEPAYNPQ